MIDRRLSLMLVVWAASLVGCDKLNSQSDSVPTQQQVVAPAASAKTPAEKKLAAFNAVVAKYKAMPDQYASPSEKAKFQKELETLQDEFIAMPFDAANSDAEAKEMVKSFDEEMSGHYLGELYNGFEQHIFEIRGNRK